MSATITDKTFVMEHVFTNVKKILEFEDVFGVNQKHCNLFWDINMSRDDKQTFWFGLLCANNDEKRSENWSVNTEFEFRLIGKEVLTLKANYIFNADCSDWDQLVAVKESQIDQYLIDGNLRVEFCVKILKAEGVKGMKSKFDESMKKFSDVVLVVDGEKFYVSKTYLASRSTYFELLLMGDFRETNQSEIVLQGVDVDDFQVFLQILYHEAKLNDQNLESVLRVADMYETKCVLEQAEEFLLKSMTRTKTEKFLTAMKYNLVELKKSILTEDVSASEIRSFLPEDLNQLDKGTLTELFTKYLSATTDLYRIFVKTLNRKTVEFMVHSTDTISNLKSKIEEKEGISSRQQRLIYSGNLLDNEKTLGQYSITRAATIMMVYGNREY